MQFPRVLDWVKVIFRNSLPGPDFEGSRTPGLKGPIPLNPKTLHGI